MGRKNTVVRRGAVPVAETAPAVEAEVKPAAPAAIVNDVAHVVAKRTESEYVKACRSFLFGDMPVI